MNRTSDDWVSDVIVESSPLSQSCIAVCDRLAQSVQLARSTPTEGISGPGPVVVRVELPQSVQRKMLIHGSRELHWRYHSGTVLRRHRLHCSFAFQCAAPPSPTYLTTLELPRTRDSYATVHGLSTS